MEISSVAFLRPMRSARERSLQNQDRTRSPLENSLHELLGSLQRWARLSIRWNEEGESSLSSKSMRVHCLVSIPAKTHDGRFAASWTETNQSDGIKQLITNAEQMSPMFRCLICRQTIERSTRAYWKHKGHLLCSSCKDKIESDTGESEKKLPLKP